MSSMFEIYASLFRNKRLLILVGALSGSFAILSFFSEPFLIYFGRAFRVDIGETSVPITLLLISIVSFSFIYLQSGGKETPEIHNSPILEKVLDELDFLIFERRRRSVISLASEGQESNIKFFKNLVLPIIPRVLLVIFVEVFAYFFLRLYKDGLSEIKYFQNELTNVEAKLAAVQFSFITNNSEGLKASIESLSKTERNFILEKGQTTVELERAKSESELTRNIIKTIPDFFKKSSK